MEQEKKNQNGAQELSVGDQIKVRREKLANLQAEGRNPFEITKFVQTTNSAKSGKTSTPWRASLFPSPGA